MTLSRDVGRPRAVRVPKRVTARKYPKLLQLEHGIPVALGVVMFDNLFGFTGPLGTAFALVGLMMLLVTFFSVSNRVALATGRVR